MYELLVFEGIEQPVEDINVTIMLDLTELDKLLIYNNIHA
tara:strand:+ start:195 stop:314 length:120 start_codon:yes stop_codon:yes gene_type:complete